MHSLMKFQPINTALPYQWLRHSLNMIQEILSQLVFLKFHRLNAYPVFFYTVMTGNSSLLLNTAGVTYCCSINQYREFTQADLSQKSVAYPLEEYWKTQSTGYFRAFLSAEFVIYKMSSSLVCYSGNLLRGNEQEIWHYFQHNSL